MGQERGSGQVYTTPFGPGSGQGLARTPARRNVLLIVGLVLAACILSLACLACGVTAWLRLGSGALARWLAPAVQVQPGAPAQLPGAPPAGRQDGELRLYGDDPVTLDPALVGDSTSSGYIDEIFSGLVTLDRKLEVVPDLAASWTMSEDGRTYTFTLRPDAAFHDGRPVTAGDFKYSLERACSPALGSNSAPTYLSDIEGARDVMQGRAKEIRGLQVIDTHTLSLTIDAPKAYFLAKLTYPTAFVVDRANVEQGADWIDHPNGTGPFRLVQRDDKQIVLERNARFYGGAPRLERVTFTISGGMPITMYENGQLDIVEVGLGDTERALDPSNPLHAELTVVDDLAVEYLGMDVQVPPFDDPKVRQAFAHAIDSERLASVVLMKTVAPAKGVLPPGLPGYQAELQGLEFDPDLALKCLSESRYKDAADLPEVVLHTGGEGGMLSPIEEAIVAMLRENLGVEVTVEQTPWDGYLRDLDAHRYGFFLSGWIADYPDPEDFLDVLLHSGSANNHSRYHNAEVDRLLEQARVEPDNGQRLELYRQAEVLVVQDAAWVPLWHSRRYMLTKPYVGGVIYTAAMRPWLRDVYLQH